MTSHNHSPLSDERIYRIRQQGYFNQSKKEITDLATGNRFAYQVCVTILFLGMVTADIHVLAFMNVIAFLGIVLPNHPFDYIYNHLLSKRLGKPKLPPRSRQLKFACGMATAGIAATIYLFSNEMMVAGYINGFSLVLVAGLVSTIDLCIPSVIYNFLFLNRQKLAAIKPAKN